MTDSSPSPFSTPKRKRTNIVLQDGPSPPSSQQFSFDVDSVAGSVPISGSSSPRTKVAQRFCGLALVDQEHAESGGGVAAQQQEQEQGPLRHRAAAAADNDTGAVAADRMQIDEDESKMRKRTRISPAPPDTTSSGPQQSGQPAAAEIPETPDAARSQPRRASDPSPAGQPRFALVRDDAAVKPSALGQFALDQTILTSSPKPSPAKLSRPHPASNRPVETLKTRGRKRAGTPPPSAASRSTATTDAQVVSIIDPIRAALTWHEDEITVYDPEDDDDDGVGINGIGFKPTPAIAYARTMKRRQQLAEYKKREEREARARRSHRRRGGSPERSSAAPPPQLKRQDSGGARKVRFNEAEGSMMIETI